jgi:hypothetical protein
VTRTPPRVVVLFLIAALVALPGFAATHATQAKKPGGLMPLVVQLLHGLFPGLEKAHGTMDPNGQPDPEPAWKHAYEEVFQRAFAFATEEEQRIALEKLRGWGQWAMLEPLNPQVRFAVVEADPTLYPFYHPDITCAPPPPPAGTCRAPGRSSTSGAPPCRRACRRGPAGG